MLIKDSDTFSLDSHAQNINKSKDRTAPIRKHTTTNAKESFSIDAFEKSEEIRLKADAKKRAERSVAKELFEESMSKRKREYTYSN
jgi:hypothetical protein